MSIEDTFGYQNESQTCVVCGKGVEGNRGFARVNHNGVMVDLCCPLCLETFQGDPEPHMARLRKVNAYRELRKLRSGLPEPE
jgi:hypothetical protein